MEFAWLKILVDIISLELKSFAESLPLEPDKREIVSKAKPKKDIPGLFRIVEIIFGSCGEFKEASCY